MKKETLFEVIGDIDEKAVKAAEAAPAGKSRRSRIVIKCIAIAACIGIIVGGGMWFLRSNGMVVAAAAYPEMKPYPGDFSGEEYDAWREKIRELRDQPDGYEDGFGSFFVDSAKVFLKGGGSENKLYSPLSLYMALAVSAEITGGNTRQQIIDALSQNDMDSLRSHAKSIWLANYMNDGMARCVLASSLWMNESVKYSRETVDSVAENYYASVFSGDPDSDRYNDLLRDWINEQTDGLLDDYVSEIKMDPQMLITLASTVNYSGKWYSEFNKEKTKADTFHSPSGDVRCEFMNSIRDDDYFWGDKFSSVSMRLENNGVMRLILPDEGVDPEELFNDAECVEFMLDANNYEYKNRKYVEITLSVPKFDLSSEIDLKDGLKEMGVSDVFDSSKSDFSSLTDNASGVFLSKAEQNTRVTIDEEGCKAASLTVMIGFGAAMPEGSVDFTLDRPFIFEIVSDTGLPLFVGIVNNPSSVS